MSRRGRRAARVPARVPSPAAPLPAPAPRGQGAALLAILGLAAALRLALWLHTSGPLWLEEDIPLQLAFALKGLQEGRFDLDPLYPLWPHLSVYFFLAVQLLHYALGRAFGIYPGLADFRAEAALDPTMLRATAMLAAIGVSLATLWAAWRLARRRVGGGAALLVPLVLTLDPIHLQHSLVISPDMLLTLCVLLGLAAACDAEEGGTRRAFLRTGFWAGLGAAAKYTPALLLLPAAWAAWKRRAPTRAMLSAASAAVAFALASPYTLGDLVQGARGARTAAQAVTGGRFGGVGGPAALEHALGNFPDALGWPLWLLMLAAALWVVARRRERHAVLLAFALPYAGLVALLPVAFPRYLLPLTPVLALFAADGAKALHRAGRGRVAGVAAAAALVGLVVQSAVFFAAQRASDSRALAERWLRTHVPRDAAVAAEALGPHVPRREHMDAAARASGLSPERRRRLAGATAYWVFPIPYSPEHPAATAPFYDPVDYADFDLVLTSGSVAGRYLADTARFDRHAAFYRALDRFFDVAWRSPGTAVGPALTAYRPSPAKRAALEAWWAGQERRLSPDTIVGARGPAASAFARRAQIHLLAGRYPAAARDWLRALEWKEAPAQWWFEYGWTAASQEAWESARAAYSEAFRRDRGRGDAALAWAEAAERCGRLAESAGALEAALSLPGLPPAERRRAERLQARLRSAASTPRARP